MSTHFADTNRAMIHHVTLSIESTGTRIFANCIDAGLRIAAGVVSFTSRHNWRQSLAASLVIGDVTFRTLADHGLDGQGLDHFASSRSRAGTESDARIFTLFIQAHLTGRTISIFNALGGGNWNTLLVGVAGVPNQTATLGNVILWYAFGIGAAWIVSSARIQALAIVAGFAGWTFGIHSASDWCASDEWVAFEAFKAPTIRLVCLGEALGIGTTRVVQKTGLNAVALDTHIRIAAIIVALTSNRDT